MPEFRQSRKSASYWAMQAPTWYQWRSFATAWPTLIPFVPAQTHPGVGSSTMFEGRVGPISSPQVIPRGSATDSISGGGGAYWAPVHTSTTACPAPISFSTGHMGPGAHWGVGFGAGLAPPGSSGAPPKGSPQAPNPRVGGQLGTITWNPSPPAGHLIFFLRIA